MKSLKKGYSQSRGFTITIDCPRNGDYRRPARNLNSIGAVNNVRFPRTTYRFCPHSGIPFRIIKRAVLNSIDPQLGSAIIFSRKTGNEYWVNNRGNRPGRVVRV
jgi:hypothetical protein